MPPREDPKKRKLLKRLRKHWIESGLARMLSGLGLLLRTGLPGDRSMDKIMVASMRIAYGLGKTTRALGISYSPYR